MALFGRNRQSSKYDGGRPISPEDLEHFRTWCATRAGSDGYVEPATVVNPVSLLIDDILGEYTRRPIGSWDVADKLGRELGFAVYAADETGYPRRMRERDEAMRLKQKRERRERMREEMRRLEQERNER